MVYADSAIRYGRPNRERASVFMRIWFYILAAGTMLAGAGMVMTASKAQAPAEASRPAAQPGNAHQFTLTRIDGRPMPMSQFRGKVVLLVNTASMCGFTPQYEGLQKLHSAMAPRGFTVIGVPSGDFGGQEHGDNARIKEFCETTFGINFPMSEKSVVKGEDAIPIYRWARANLAANNEPRWNFHKFLIGKDGRIIAGFGSRTTPDDPALRAAIERALAA
jgi:glutathione peroxidase